MSGGGRKLTMGRQSGLTLEQRTEAVLSLLRREEPATKIARRFGISEPTLYRYRDLFLEAGKAGLAHGSGLADPARREVAELKKQLDQRDQVIGEITIANRILKKLYLFTALTGSCARSDLSCIVPSPRRSLSMPFFTCLPTGRRASSACPPTGRLD